jgi:hypothetical protein
MLIDSLPGQHERIWPDRFRLAPVEMFVEQPILQGRRFF